MVWAVIGSEGEWVSHLGSWILKLPASCGGKEYKKEVQEWERLELRW
jgi:hypothetical protein